MKKAYEINEMELNAVNGGTFPCKHYEKYTEHGITVEHHFVVRDTFILPDGTRTDRKGADKYVLRFQPTVTYSEILNVMD